MSPEQNVKKVAINTISVDPTLQIRVDFDTGVVKEYAAIVADRDMDPVTLFDTGKALLLADGAHRRAAYIKAGKTEIPAVTVKGTHSDALRYSIQKNCRHGIKVTNQDKRRAASLAVLDADLAKLPDAELGELIGVSGTLVADCRRGETPAAKRERAASRKSKNGQGPAVVSVTAHERRKVGETRPTKAMCLKSIESWTNDSLVDEADIIKLFESAKGEYVFLPKEGGDLKVTVVGKTGRAQIADIKMIVKDLNFEEIKLKSEKFVISAEKA